MRTTELIHLTADAPLSVKAGSILLAAVLFIALAAPILFVGAAVVA
jgi:hypothetical protein